MLWAVVWGNLLGTVLRGRKLPGAAIAKIIKLSRYEKKCNFVAFIN